MLAIRPFQARDQDEVKSLILSGLVEHWGWLDSDKNQDLDNVYASYAAGFFLTAWIDNGLVGTGALILEVEGVTRVARVVRMSVASNARRQGIGSAILVELINQAKIRGCQTIVLETTSTWQDAIGFYLAYGFCITSEHDGDTHFNIKL